MPISNRPTTWFSGGDQLLLDFFRQFRTQIGKQPDPSGKLKGLSEKLDLFAKILAPVTWIPAVSPFAEKVKKLAEATAEVLGKAAKEKGNDANQAKEDICAILRLQEARILVVLDDLDRLRPDELRQVFQVVKAVADFPKTIYLLSYDVEAVIEALEKAGVHAPAQYLEKIVQAPFDLPEPDWYGLRAVAGEHIDELVAETPKGLWDEKRFRELYLGGLDTLLRGPRDVKRLFNILRPAYPPVRGEVDLVDFIGIHAIRLFAPSVFRFIVNNKAMMTNSQTKFTFDEKAEKESRRKVMEVVLEDAEAEREAVNTILQTMFPIWNARAGPRSFGDDSESRWRKARRVCSVDVFDLFFRLSIPEGALSSSEVKAILAQTSQPPQFCAILLRLASERAFDGETKLGKFLQYSGDYLRDAGQNVSIDGLVSSVFSCGDSLSDKQERQILPFWSTEWKLFRFVASALGTLSESTARQKPLTDALEQGTALSLMVFVVQVWTEQAKGRDGTSDRNTFDLKQLSAMAGIVSEKIAAAATDGSLRRTPHLDRVLTFWADQVGLERVKAYGEELAQDEEGLADLVVAALTSVTLSSAGEKFQSSPAFVEELTGLSTDSIATRCEAWLDREPAWMTDLRRVAIQTFRDAVRESRNRFGP